MELLSSRLILRSSDPERCLTFYRDMLGLAVYREFPGGTVLFLGQGFLEISGRGDSEPSDAVRLWLRVRDLPATLDELRQRGVTVTREARREPWGLDEAWISDPDGLRIVLVEVPADHPMRVDLR